jgi:pimeloyl-ACP methyl ester carboxylesterase
VRAARTRTNHFADRGETIEAYRSRKMFRRWRPEVFDDYWETALVEDGPAGWTLRYPRRWEARIFRVSPHDLWSELGSLRVPSLFIQGEYSDSFHEAAVRKVQQQVPGARLERFESYGHCVPMECPERVGDTLLQFLTELRS